MPAKVLLHEDREFRVRLLGEDHTSLQLFRSRLNDMAEVEYANYFPGHPVLDEPEFYVRLVSDGVDAGALMTRLAADLSTEFAAVALD